MDAKSQIKILGSLKDELADLDKKLKVNNRKDCVAAQEKYIDAYQKVLEGEKNVIGTLPCARERGVKGDNLDAFKKDKIFSAAFKAYDKCVDALDEAHQHVKHMFFLAHSLIEALDALDRRADKELKDAKDLQYRKLKTAIAEARKEQEAAQDIFRKGSDRKIEDYTKKYQKQIERLLEQAPPSDEKDTALPKHLDERTLVETVMALKKAGRVLSGHCEKCREATDLKLAASELQSASKAMKDIRKLLVPYKNARKAFGKLLAKQAAGKALLKRLDEVEALNTAAEDDLRHTELALKKRLSAR